MRLAILFLLIIMKEFQQCQIGCLKCEKNQKICLLCDFKNFYFLENGICLKNKIENCALSFKKDKCQICEKNYYPSNSSCHKIDQEKTIQNCNYYDSEKKCVACDDNFFLSNQICKLVENPVSQCISYDQQGFCVDCKKGILHNNSCLFNEKMITNEKCFIFNSPRKNPDFEIDINLFNLNKEIKDLEKIRLILEHYYISNQLNQKFDILNVLYPNCEAFNKTKSICEKCKKGFYLGLDQNKEKICKKEEKNNISKCEYFLTKEKCRLCQKGFYLNDKKECERFKEEEIIENCSKQNSVTKLCDECEEDFYVESNKCVKRQTFTKNCAVYDQKGDFCKSCLDGFFYMEEHKKCYKSIPSCIINLVESGNVICKTCERNLAPSHNKKHCIKTPLIKNCQEYSSFYKCGTCKKEFIKKGNLCVKIPDPNILNCEEIEKDDFRCKKCPSNSFQIKSFEECKLIKMANCKEIRKEVCHECKDYFYFNSNNKCIEGTISNCKRYLNTSIGNQICVECDEDFVVENNTCRRKIKIFSKNCEKIVSENCIVCNPNFFPLSLNFRNENFEDIKQNVVNNKNTKIEQEKTPLKKDIEETENILTVENVYKYLNTLSDITHYDFLAKTMKYLEMINSYDVKDKQKNLKNIIEEIKKRKDIEILDPNSTKKKNQESSINNQKELINSTRNENFINQKNIYEDNLNREHQDFEDNKIISTEKKKNKKSPKVILEKNLNSETKDKSDYIKDEKIKDIIGNEKKNLSDNNEQDKKHNSGKIQDNFLIKFENQNKDNLLNLEKPVEKNTDAKFEMNMKKKNEQEKEQNNKDIKNIPKFNNHFEKINNLEEKNKEENIQDQDKIKNKDKENDNQQFPSIKNETKNFILKKKDNQVNENNIAQILNNDVVNEVKNNNIKEKTLNKESENLNIEKKNIHNIHKNIEVNEKERSETNEKEKSEKNHKDKIEFNNKEKLEFNNKERLETNHKDKFEKERLELNHKEKLEKEKSELNHKEKSEMHNKEMSEMHNKEMSEKERLELNHKDKSELNHKEKSELNHKEKSEVNHKDKSEMHNKEMSEKERLELNHKDKSEINHKEKSEMHNKEKSELNHKEKSEMHNKEMSEKERSDIDHKQKLELNHKEKLEKEKSELNHKEKSEMHNKEMSEMHNKEMSEKERLELNHKDKSEINHKEKSEMHNKEKSELNHKEKLEKERSDIDHKEILEKERSDIDHKQKLELNHKDKSEINHKEKSEMHNKEMSEKERLEKNHKDKLEKEKSESNHKELINPKSPHKIVKEINIQEGRFLQSKVSEEFENDFFKKSATNITDFFQICSENNLYNSYSNTRNCVIFNTFTKECDLCKENFGIQNGRCIICDQFDLTSRYCLENKKDLGCLLSDKELNCYKCKDNLTFLRLTNLPIQNITFWINKQKNVSTELEENAKICDIKISPKCETNFCKEVVEVDKDVFCCKICENGKSGINETINNLPIVKNCNYFESCRNHIFIKNIPLEIRNRLTCHYCEKEKILSLNTQEKNQQLSCVNRKEQVDNCYLIENEKCLLCEPGYKLIEKKCEIIDKCKYSQKINFCEVCEESHSIDTKGNCIENKVKNCQESDKHDFCSVCKDGYINYKNHCFQINDDLCDVFDKEKCIHCKKEEDLIIKISLDLNKEKTSNLKTICTEISPDTHINGCKKYKDLNFCIECQNKFILKKINANTQICEDKFGTQNCELIDSESNCIICSKGYYPIEGICLKGELNYCEVYKDKDNCSKCQEGYFLINKNNTTYCYLEPNIKNCLKFDIESFLDKQIKCESCVEGFYKEKLTFENEVCFESDIVVNCKIYDKNKCLECVDNHFLNKDGLCIFRKNFIYHCEVYQTHHDSCFYCEKGFYLDEVSEVCVEIENIIKHCRQYEEKNTCTKCDPDYYLFKNECLPVKKKIRGCLVYENFHKCEICKKNYFLAESGDCVLKSNFENCIEFTKKGECLKCKKDHFLEDGQLCKKVSNLVKDCEFYSKDGICSKCDFPFILRQNNCLSLFDMETDKINNILNPVCLFCDPSYFPNELGICQKIIDHEGCAFDLENGNCFACSSGYYQNEEGRCTKNFVVKEEEITKQNIINKESQKREDFLIKEFKMIETESMIIFKVIFYLWFLVLN